MVEKETDKEIHRDDADHINNDEKDPKVDVTVCPDFVITQADSGDNIIMPEESPCNDRPGSNTGTATV